ncbi:hypothetical protein Tco_1504851 [Tanacetum coccineum]
MPKDLHFMPYEAEGFRKQKNKPAQSSEMSRAAVEGNWNFINLELPRYPKETMGYSFYSPSENKVFVARKMLRRKEMMNLKVISIPIRSPQGQLRPTESIVFVQPILRNMIRGDLGEPANYKAALLDPESKKWLDAMNVEMQP